MSNEIYIALLEVEKVTIERIDKLLEESERNNCIAQVIRKDAIAGPHQLLLSILETYLALSKKSTIARRPSLELLLRISGTRQIRDAIRNYGAIEGARGLVIIICRDIERVKEFIRKVPEILMSKTRIIDNIDELLKKGKAPICTLPELCYELEQMSKIEMLKLVT